MNEIQTIYCRNTTPDWKFSIKFLNDTVDISSRTSVVQFMTHLETRHAGLGFDIGYNTTQLSSDDAFICSTGGTTTTIRFDKPVSLALPTMHIVQIENLDVWVTPVVDAIDSRELVLESPGLYKFTYTPMYKGLYDISVKISGSSVSNDLWNGVLFTPAIEYAATSTHNISQVNEEGVLEYFTVQLRDRFGNTLDGPMNPDSHLLVSMIGTSDICQSDVDKEGTVVGAEIPVEVLLREPYTDGIYTMTYNPTIAGSYELSVKLYT
jgi:hypothetical protein